MRIFKPQLVIYFILFSLLLSVANTSRLIQKAHAQNAGHVVINEIAWVGSRDNSSDEWIELFNPTDQIIDLTGWKIIDDELSEYLISRGTVERGGYFLIEDHETAVNSISADLIIPISLANLGDSLELQNAQGETFDRVNSNGGAWFAGNNTDKTTMERISASISGDEPGNWKNNTNPSGAVASGGSTILGTPRAVNSPQAPNESPTFLVLSVNNPLPHTGDVIEVTGEVFDAFNLFAYGVELIYNAEILEYKNTEKASFLNQNDQIPTSFQTGLENNAPGTLIIGEARTMTNEKTGITGEGQLFKVRFEVIEEDNEQTDIQFGEKSFLATPEGDLDARLQGVEITISNEEGEDVVSEVRNLVMRQGQQRYSLTLSWDSPLTGADEYIVKRQKPNGGFEDIARLKTTTYTDVNTIVPLINYTYQIIAENDGELSEPVQIAGAETRGIMGDNDRSDRVDGRDLQNLAEHFGESIDDERFTPLIDTTYDGRIDGNDLIDMGANWAKIFAL